MNAQSNRTQCSRFFDSATRRQNGVVQLILTTLFISWIFGAAVESLTIDEAATLETATTLESADFFSAANFHPVNSLSVRLSMYLMGDSELSIRCLNILAGGGFLIVSYLMFRRRKVFGFSFIVLLVGNPYVSDFFSLSRGYGAGMFFLLVFLLLFEESSTWSRPVRRTVIFLSLAGIFAVYCNYSYIVFVAPGIGLILLHWMLHSNYRVSLELIACSMVGFLPIVFIVRRMEQYGLLYYGGRTSFWDSTVGSLIRTYLYGAPYQNFAHPIIVALLSLSLLIITTNWIYTVYFEKGYEQAARFAGLIFTCMSFCVFSAVFMGKFYLVERTAIGFWPVWVMATYWAVADIYRRMEGGIRRKTVESIIAVLTLVGAVHFAFACARYTNYSWFWDSGSKRFVEDLETLAVSRGRVKVGVSGYHAPVIRYYLENSQFRDSIELVDDAVIFPLFNPGYPQISAIYYGGRVPDNCRRGSIIRMLDDSYCDIYYIPEFYFDKIALSESIYSLTQRYPEAKMVSLSTGF